ncbi:MAG: alpha/beta fold hydrolase [Candidatus Rokubacteria bacterium]|nr:alpha/beta fold hydrolase [Candidatus Rokubacteria bacterium]
MDNPVVVRVVEVSAALGLATIRFNFRGVGGSTGAYGGGEPEQRDLLAAVAEIRKRLPDGSPIVVAGYSFGSLVAADVAAAGDVAALALIAPPVGLGDSRRLPALPPHLPVAVVVGTLDEYCPPEATERLRAELATARVTVIDGANHFFLGKLFPVGEALRAWLETTLEELARQPRRRRGAG